MRSMAIRPVREVAQGGRALEALLLVLLPLSACGQPPEPREPAGPELGFEVIRRADRPDAFGVPSLRVDSEGRPHVLFNDLEHQAVGLAHRDEWTWSVEYPVTQASWMVLGLELGEAGGFRIRYAEQPRRIVDAAWQEGQLEQQGSIEASEAEFEEQRRAAGRVEDEHGRVCEVGIASPTRLTVRGRTAGACAELGIEAGSRLAGSTAALALDAEGRPHVAFVVEPLRPGGASGAMRLEHAVCVGDRWVTSPVAPAAAPDVAIAIDAEGRLHIVFVRPGQQGGVDLVHATAVAAPRGEPSGASGCPVGLREAGGSCEPVDPRIAPALAACGRIPIADEPVADPWTTGDGWRCAQLNRTAELAGEAERYAAARCDRGEAEACSLAGALRDTVTASMTFDPLICQPPPGGTCFDHTLYTSGIAFRHVPQDRGQALVRYRRACEAGHERACLRLAALALAEDRDPRLALPLALRHCEAGNLAGCALAIEATRGVELDGADRARARALVVFEERCGRGQPSACDNLGYALQAGEGIGRNGERAAELFRRACEAGHEPACQNARALDRAGAR